MLKSVHPEQIYANEFYFSPKSLWAQVSISKINSCACCRAHWSAATICAKEGSARYVGEILVNHGFKDVRYLEGGIKTWGNMLVPKLVATGDGYKLYQFIRPGKASCSYALIYNEEMVLFDPSRNVEFYQRFAENNGARIVKSCETHLQADYISGSPMLLT